MAEPLLYLEQLDDDVADAKAWTGLESIARNDPSRIPKAELLARRERWVSEGDGDAAQRAMDLEYLLASSADEKAALLCAKAEFLLAFHGNVGLARECFVEATTILRGETENEVLATAQEGLEQIELLSKNWQRVVAKYVAEAESATDRALKVSLWISAATTVACYGNSPSLVEQYLQRAVELDPANPQASSALGRVLRGQGRVREWAELLRRHARAATGGTRVRALAKLADLFQNKLEEPEKARECFREILETAPNHATAMHFRLGELEAANDWIQVLSLYEKARQVATRKHDTVAMTLQMGMVLWKHIGDSERAAREFERVLAAEPAQPAALEFFREFHERNPEAWLAVLQKARQATPGDTLEHRHRLELLERMISRAQLARGIHSPADLEKEIAAAKKNYASLVDGKSFAGNQDSRAEEKAVWQRLNDLYRMDGRWNPLLDHIKHRLDRVPMNEQAERVSLLLQLAEVYRDHLKLDVMVVNTYSTILTIDPDNGVALSALASRYKERSQFSELLQLLTKQAENERLPAVRRVACLKEIADVWVEKFGNFAQAVKPLERLLEIAPADLEAIARLKDIYARRKQWRAYMNLIEREMTLSPESSHALALAEIAKIATDQLGDHRTAIDKWNRVLELSARKLADEVQARAALDQLAALYEREKRLHALVSVLSARGNLAGDRQEKVQCLERIAFLWSERLDSPSLAIATYEEILRLDEQAAPAQKHLQRLYLAQGDVDGLEALLGKEKRWEELVEALLDLAEKVPDIRTKPEDSKTKTAFLLRAATLVDQNETSVERKIRAYERVLSVDPEHEVSMDRLAALFREAGQTKRLLQVLEWQLGRTQDAHVRGELLRELASVSEASLGSKQSALQWKLALWHSEPANAELLREIEELATSSQKWQILAGIYQQIWMNQALSSDARREALRKLARVTERELGENANALEFWKTLWSEAALPGEAGNEASRKPGNPSRRDKEAEVSMERLAIALADYRALADLLAFQQQNPDPQTGSPQENLRQKERLAKLYEEQLRDPNQAIEWYRQILKTDPAHGRAQASLRRLLEREARIPELAAFLITQAEAAAPQDAAGLWMRIGSLQEKELNQPQQAAQSYEKAWEISGASQAANALERWMNDFGDEAYRIKIAGLLLPYYQRIDAAEKVAWALELLRKTDDAEQRKLYNRKLVSVYSGRLDAPLRAYDAALRLFAEDPHDRELRTQLVRLASRVGLLDDVLSEFAEVMEKTEDATQKIALAEHIFDLTKSGHSQLAEQALAVLRKAKPDDLRVLEDSERVLRLAENWPAVRDILREKARVQASPKGKVNAFLASAELSDAILKNPTDAIADAAEAWRLDPSDLRVRDMLVRLYTENQKWEDLATVFARSEDLAPDKEKLSWRLLRADLAEKRGLLAEATEHVTLAWHIANGRAQPSEQLIDDLAARLLRVAISQDDERLRAKLLEPYYRSKGWVNDELAAIALLLPSDDALPNADSATRERLARKAQLLADNGNDRPQAFTAYLQVLSHTVEPLVIVKKLAALADNTTQWQTLTGAISDVIGRVEDAKARMEMRLLLAKIYEEQLHDSAQALDTLRTALQSDEPTVEQRRELLLRMVDLGQLTGSPQLADDLERAILVVDDAPMVVHLTRQLASLKEEQGDHENAIVLYERAKAWDAGDPSLADTLLRLYKKLDLHEKQAQLLMEHAGRARRDSEAARLKNDVAKAYVAAGNMVRAEAVWRQALIDNPRQSEAFWALKQHLSNSGRYEELAELVRNHLAHETDLTICATLSFELAELYLSKLDRTELAIDLLEKWAPTKPVEVVDRLLPLREIPQWRKTVSQILSRIHEAQGDISALTSLWEEEAALCEDAQEASDMWQKASSLRENALGDQIGALTDMRRAVICATQSPTLLKILRNYERMALSANRQHDLFDVYDELIAQVLDGQVKRTLLLEVAELAERLGRDLSFTEQKLELVLEDWPEDIQASQALESLYRKHKNFEGLARLLEKRISDTEKPHEKISLWAELAQIAETSLHDTELAISSWQHVGQLAPDNSTAHQALERLLRKEERWSELAEVLTRDLARSSRLGDAVETRYRLGELYEMHLADYDAAAESYRLCLVGNPGHRAALSALERLAESGPGARAATRILEPIYVASHDWQKLLPIYQTHLAEAEDDEERREVTLALAALSEDQLEDLPMAFSWYGKVLQESPTDGQVRAQVVRLANVQGMWPELADLYEEVLSRLDALSPEAKEYCQWLAECAEKRLGDTSRARKAYERAWKVDYDPHILAELERLISAQKEWDEMLFLYETALDRTFDDTLRKSIYRRMADIYETYLENSEKAQWANRQALAISQDDETLATLERLLSSSGKWGELAALLTMRIESSDPASAIPDRLWLAEIYEQKLNDLPEAITEYTRALTAAEPPNATALVALERLVVEDTHQEQIIAVLEPVYRRLRFWHKLIVILTAKRNLPNFVSEGPGINAELFRLHQKYGDKKTGVKAGFLSLKEEPTVELLDLLAPAAIAEELAAPLAELCFELGKAFLNDDDAIFWFEKAAGFFEENANDLRRALQSWQERRLLREDEPCLVQIERLLRALNEPVELVEVLEKRVELAFSREAEPEEKTALVYALAEVLRGLDRIPDAEARYREVLDIDPMHSAAQQAVESILVARDDRPAIIAFLERLLELEESSDKRDLLRIRLAGLLEKEGELGVAVSHWQATEFEAGADPERGQHRVSELDRLFRLQDAWHDVVKVRDDWSAGGFADLAFDRDTAVLVFEKLDDYTEASARFERLLVVDRGGETLALLTKRLVEPNVQQWALPLLEQWFRKNSDVSASIVHYRRWLGFPEREDDFPRVRQALATALEIKEDWFAAFDTWAEIYAKQEFEQAEQKLRQLADRTGQYKEFIAVVERELDETTDSVEKTRVALMLGELAERSLGDVEQAARFYERASEASPTQSAPFEALERVLAVDDSRRISVLEKYAEVSEPAARVAILERLGAACEHVHAWPQAADAYHQIVELEPNHNGAAAHLLGLLEQPEVFGDAGLTEDIAGYLEPVYLQRNDFRSLAELLEKRAGFLGAGEEKAQLLARATEIWQKANEPLRALDSAGAWFAEVPASEAAWGALTDISKQTGRMAEFAVRIESILDGLASSPSTEQADVERKLTLALSQTYCQLGTPEKARPALSRALTRPQLETVELWQEVLEWSKLVGDGELLAKAHEWLGKDSYEPAVSAKHFLQAGQKREQLHQIEQAAANYRLAIEREPESPLGHDNLCGLLARQNSWQELLAALENALRFADDAQGLDAAARKDREIKLNRQIAQLKQENEASTQSKIDAWRQVLQLVPDDVEAITFLFAGYKSLEDWVSAAEMMEAKIRLASDDNGKVGLLVELAELERDKNKDDVAATAVFERVLAIAPDHSIAASAIADILTKEDRVDDAVDHWDRLAASAEKRENRNLAARYWLAGLALCQAHGLVTRRQELTQHLVPYANHAEVTKWQVEQLLASGDTEQARHRLLAAEGIWRGSDAAWAHKVLAKIEKQQGKLAEAQNHLQKALSLSPDDASLHEELYLTALAIPDLALLPGLAQQRFTRSNDSQKAEIAAALLSLAQTHSSLRSVAVELVGQLSEDRPIEIDLQLAALHEAAGVNNSARDTWAKIAERYKKQRKLKEAGMARLSEGRLAQNMGESEKAKQAMEEAFRFDPGNVAIMIELALLYRDMRAWEDAKRVLRGLVLQPLTGEHKLTKSDAYLELGAAHRESGEKDKAKQMFMRGLEIDRNHEALKQALAALG